jgi:hypothetical protein
MGWNIRFLLCLARDEIFKIVLFMQINLLASSDHAKGDSDAHPVCPSHIMGAWCTILYVLCVELIFWIGFYLNSNNYILG